MGRRRRRRKKLPNGDAAAPPREFQPIAAESPSLREALAHQLEKLTAENEALATSIAALEGELRASRERLATLEANSTSASGRTYRDPSSDIIEGHRADLEALCVHIDTKRLHVETNTRTGVDLRKRLAGMATDPAVAPPQDSVKSSSWWNVEVESTLNNEDGSTYTESSTRRDIAVKACVLFAVLLALFAALYWIFGGAASSSASIHAQLHAGAVAGLSVSELDYDRYR